MTVKSTLLALYLRLFSPHPRAKLLVWSGLVFIVIFYTISVVVDLASCLPREALGEDWSLYSSFSRALRCQKEDEKFAEAQAVIGAFTDIYVWSVPMVLLSGLRLSQKRRTGVYGVFLAGFM
jgi:hypothetical protein